MFQRAITLQQQADLFDDLEVVGRIRDGLIWTTTGNHPELGPCVFIADHNEGTILFSTFPYSEPLSESHTAALDGFADLTGYVGSPNHSRPLASL